MSEGGHDAGRRSPRPAWFQTLAHYETQDPRQVRRQLLNTGIPLAACYTLAFVSVAQGYPYWVTLVFSLLVTGLLMRSFIFLHDCSHGSYFASPRANSVLGNIVGVLTWTPYAQWRWSHLRHHATFGNLDKRGVGDIWLLTVEEYRAASRWKRLVYRVYRHPLFMFGIGSTLLFGLVYRFPTYKSEDAPGRSGVLLTDLAIVVLAVGVSLLVGPRAYFLVQGPALFTAWTLGVWLFYVQHQFAGVHWAREEKWDFIRAAMEGSSHYRLPPVLQWVTGNIGLHHLHHLRARIPNYRLQECYDAIPGVHVTPLTLRSSLHSLRLNLWDEPEKKLVSFHDIARAP